MVFAFVAASLPAGGRGTTQRVFSTLFALDAQLCGANGDEADRAAHQVHEGWGAGWRGGASTGRRSVRYVDPWQPPQAALDAVLARVASECHFHAGCMAPTAGAPVVVPLEANGAFRLPEGAPFATRKGVVWRQAKGLVVAAVCEPHEQLAAADASLAAVLKLLRQLCPAVADAPAEVRAGGGSSWWPAGGPRALTTCMASLPRAPRSPSWSTATTKCTPC